MTDIETETSGLIVVTGTRPKITMTDGFQEQVDKVLEMHRDGLPQEIITMLQSPLSGVAIEGLKAAKPIIAKMIADKRKAAAQDYPDYAEVQETLEHAARVLNSNIGNTVKAKLDKHHMRLLEMDAYQILATKQVPKLRRAIKQMRIIKKKEGLSLPRPTPPRHKPKPHTSRSSDMQGPILHEIIVDDGTSKRQRAPKEPKPVFAGLPPVTPVGEVTFAHEFHWGEDDHSRTEKIERTKEGRRRRKPTGEKKGGKNK